MKLLQILLRFFADDRGVGSIYMLVLLPVFLMVAGLGMDGVAAFRTRDMLQSTADATAIGAALKLPVAGTASVTQKNNAVAAARNYAQLNMPVAGFGNVLNLNADNNGDIVFGNWDGSTFTSPAPSGTAENAIQVTVKTATANANAYPTSFLALIGKTSWDIGATAVAMNGKPLPICVLTLTSFRSNGGNSTDLQGCAIASNGELRCNGHDLGAGFAFTTENSTDCGTTQVPNSPPVSDPYAALASNIPANPCSSYPGISWSGAKGAADMASPICGDLTLSADVTVTTPSGGSVLVIENGQLNTNGHTLRTGSGSFLTVIFSGTVASGSTHAPTGNGTLDFAAPSSGQFPNIAIFQDPILTSGINIIYKGGGGGGPTWNIGGVMYLPKATLQFNGSPNSGNNGSACIILVADKITISGTGDFLAQGGCTNQPTTLAPISRLVQ